jgi:pimeloyl-ACP methyl ester carboxylesterase
MRKQLINNFLDEFVPTTTGAGSQLIHVRRIRGAQERVLLYIHGWGGSSRYWKDSMTAFAEIRNGIAPDLPGFGRSPAAADDRMYTHAGYAECLAGLLDALGVARCDVVAHSYGCGPAIHLAQREPDRVQRLVLSNFSTFRDERERRFVAAMHGISALPVRLRRFRFARGRAFARLLGSQFFYRRPADDVLQGGLEDFLAMDAHAAHVSAAASLGWDTPEALRSLTQPVLFIHARQDRIMPPRNAAYTAALAPRGRLEWIDECGHMPMVEKPEEFRTLVREWIDEGRPTADR